MAQDGSAQGGSAQGALRTAQRVESVERALALLEAFADGSPRLSLAELARRTGYYSSTVLRLAATLERNGFLRREDSGDFRLGPSLWRLGTLYERSFELSTYVRPTLEKLSARTGETAVFYIREGGQRIVLYRHHAQRSLRHNVDEGTLLPLDRGAGGHVLMAFTDGDLRARARIGTGGFAFSAGERDPETAAIAAPVFSIDQVFVGALAIVGARTRMESGDIDQQGRVVVTAADELSRSLGAGG